MKWELIDFLNVNDPPVLAALQSKEYEITLVVSLSVSATMLFELLLRILNSNATIILSLAIPDFLILSYVRRSSDLIFLNFMLRARILLFIWLVFVFIKKYGEDKWSKYSLLSSFGFLCIGRVLAYYREYFTNDLRDILALTGFISDSLTILIFIILSIMWYQFLLKNRKISIITTNQYMCNVSVTAALAMLTGFYIRLYSSPTTLEWYNWNSNELCFFSIMITIFYSVLMVFQGRAFQLEMLQTKVS